jgi:hypothetical protein
MNMNGKGIKKCHYDTVHCIIMFSCKGKKINYTATNYGPLFPVKLGIIFYYLMVY